MSRAKLSALIFCSLALLVLMFAPISIKVDRQFWDRLLDAGHLPLFFSYASLLWWTNPWNSVPASRRITVSTGVTIVIAGLVELIQPSFGRTESLEDFRNGAAGALLAGTALYLVEFRKGRRWAIVLGVVAMGICIVVLAPAWEEGRAILWRRSHFPVLGEFEDELELSLWEGQGGSEKSTTEIAFSRQHASRGPESLRVKTGEGSWAGVSYSPGEQNWRGWRVLALDVFNPGPPFRLSLRVDDDADCSKYGQRFDDGFELTNGWNYLNIPMAAIERGPRHRLLNLDKIRRLAIFTGESQPAREFYLDHVRLESNSVEP